MKYYLHIYRVGRNVKEFSNMKDLECEIKSLIRDGFHDQDLIVFNENGKELHVEMKVVVD